jgi:hypothetical protein
MGDSGDAGRLAGSLMWLAIVRKFPFTLLHQEKKFAQFRRLA